VSENPTTPTLTHANALVLAGVGIMIRGASGSGKSRLTYALLDEAGCNPTQNAGSKTDTDTALIGDDYITLEAGEQLLASPAPNLAGRIEVRGIGILGLPWQEKTPVHLVVDLLPVGDVQRLPETRKISLSVHTLEHVAVPIGDLAHEILLVRTALALLSC
jgi:serine kinase of HPr protein (carbohydrate metabolism regulator)